MNIDELNALYAHLIALKKLKRSGWVRNNIAQPESVADHSFALAILVLFFARKLGLDAGRAVTIALIHDIGESVIGDITPHDGVSKQAKANTEAAAVQEILKDEKLYALWLDFEEGRTEEGRLVKQLDKLEAYLQARQYQANPSVLNEFYASTSAAFNDPNLIKLLNHIKTIEL